MRTRVGCKESKPTHLSLPFTKCSARLWTYCTGWKLKTFTVKPHHLFSPPDLMLLQLITPLPNVALRAFPAVFQYSAIVKFQPEKTWDEFILGKVQ